MILSLQGCMAVGKTTAVRYLPEHAPDIQICFEDNSDVIAQINERNLDKNKISQIHTDLRDFWSRVRESNPPSRLGKPLYYRYTNPARWGYYSRPDWKYQ